MTLLGAVLLASCTQGRDAPARHAATIQDIRAIATGTPVTVEGIVSVRSGVIDAGFAITDGEAGIHVAADSTTRVAAGERVRVTGTRGDIHGLATVIPNHVERLGTGKLPQPKTARTGEVGEATEGLMVRVSGRAVTPIVRDLPYGYKLWIDDGSGRLQLFVAASAGTLGLDRARVGSTVTVTGFSGQYDATYEVIPASRAVLQVSAAPQ
jgi:DNA/RNA endonuclease YhcR with UshA esterase domain